nr:hypothetical protein [Ectobacillus panaciterrae]
MRKISQVGSEHVKRVSESGIQQTKEQSCLVKRHKGGYLEGFDRYYP